MGLFLLLKCDDTFAFFNGPFYFLFRILNFQFFLTFHGKSDLLGVQLRGFRGIRDYRRLLEQEKGDETR